MVSGDAVCTCVEDVFTGRHTDTNQRPDWKTDCTRRCSRSPASWWWWWWWWRWWW